MVVINQGLNLKSNYRLNDATLPVKQGDISPIVIKERISENGAKVLMRGQEVQVKFDGPIPSQDRVLVEIAQQNEQGLVVVRPVQSSPATTQTLASTKTADDFLTEAGFNPNTHIELKEAAQQIISRGGTVSKDSLVVLQDFLKNETGSLAEKLDTIKIMQQKNIQFTKVQLESVHTALYGKPLTATLEKLIGGPLEIKSNLSMKTEVKRVLQQIQKEPQLDKAITIMKEKLLPELPSNIKKILEKGINDANRLFLNGNSGMGKGAIVQALVTVEKLVNVPEITPSIESSEIEPEGFVEKYSMPLKNKEFESNVKKTLQILEISKKQIAEVTVNIERLDSFKQAKVRQAISTQSLTKTENSTEIQTKDLALSVEKIINSLDAKMEEQTINDVKKAVQIQQAGKDRIVQALANTEGLGTLKEAISQEFNLSKMIELIQLTEIPAEDTDRISLAVQEAVKLEKIGTGKLESTLQKLLTANDETGRPADSSIQEAAKLIQKEPTMGKVLEGLRKLIVEQPTEHVSELIPALQKALHLLDQGREIAARKELVNAINELEEKYPQAQKPHMDSTVSEAEQYLINEVVQTLQFDSKNLLVTEITKKLSQLAIDFKKARQEMSRNLDTASRLMEGKNPGSIVPVKQMLDVTISKLDNTILKGNFMLYTDMGMEKKLLASSSKLAEARNLLAKGNFSEANQIVNEVKDVLDKLIFKPSDTKIKHFVSDKQLFVEMGQGLDSEQESITPKSLLEKAIRPFADHELGARQVFETVKGLGLTHEADSVQALIDKQELPHNLKSALMKMVETDNNGQANQPLDQAIANITGQQLLNKQDPSGMQNLFFQLPVLLNKQMENMKIYVNSQKPGQKIDWENCNLYFVLETKKLGSVGILVSAVNRNLSITFKNNQDELQEKVKPFVELTKDRLQEIGYNVGTLQFKALTDTFQPKNEQPDLPATFTPTYSEKGYDFSI